MKFRDDEPVERLRGKTAKLVRHKEKPTMMIFPCETPVLPLTNIFNLPHQVTMPICTFPKPCGTCWYCLQHEAAKP